MGGGGSSSTGQAVSERGRGSVTNCFTGKLPDLLGVKARSSLVYTQPWISAWNMSTSSQPISHRGGAVWAADTSRFPWTMGPIPHASPLSVTGGVERQAQTEALYCSTGPQNYPPPPPSRGTSWWDQSPTLAPYLRDKVLLQPNSSDKIKRFIALLALPG